MGDRDVAVLDLDEPARRALAACEVEAQRAPLLLEQRLVAARLESAEELGGGVRHSVLLLGSDPSKLADRGETSPRLHELAAPPSSSPQRDPPCLRMRVGGCREILPACRQMRVSQVWICTGCRSAPAAIPFACGQIFEFLAARLQRR